MPTPTRSRCATDAPFVRGPIDRVGVIIPARNEAGSIAACLRSIDRAAAAAGCPADVVVAADSCRDDTVAVAGAVVLNHVEVTVLEGRWRGASPARRAATDALLAGVSEDDLTRWWLASTDADGTVAADWLVRQLAHVADGALAVAGIVDLDPVTTPRRLFRAFTESYELHGHRHEHVHAANLGVRADVYVAAGRWPVRTVVGEDHHLWRGVRALGVRTTHPTDVVVTTSARTTSRLPGGFASTLARLTRGPTPAPAVGARS